MKKLSIGILAHVDAGKTTLSEALLYVSGSIRKMGRVDNRDAFLDTDAMEKERGITIFSKQAEFVYRDMAVTLLDTPGHVDFSAETADFSAVAEEKTRLFCRKPGNSGIPSRYCFSRVCFYF